MMKQVHKNGNIAKWDDQAKTNLLYMLAPLGLAIACIGFLHLPLFLASYEAVDGLATMKYFD